MVDPVSIALAIAFVIGIIRGLPAVIDELREAGLADADARRIRRLTEAGITPARRGGSVGRYLGNVWREHVAGRGGRFGDRARRWADRWRRPGGATRGQSPARRPAVTGPVRTDATPDPAGSDRDPIRVDATVDPPAAPVIPVQPIAIDPPTQPTPVPIIAIGNLPPPNPDGGSDLERRRDPIRAGVATVGAPVRGGDGANAPLPAIAAPQQITGGTPPMSAGTVEVTGVSSGLAAARALQARVQAAVEEFATNMSAIERDIEVVAAGARGLVQFDAKGEVMTALAEAHAAAVGARRTAHSVSEVMTSLLAQVASAFQRRL